jgi:phosphonate transport system substrate-binding protein
MGRFFVPRKKEKDMKKVLFWIAVLGIVFLTACTGGRSGELTELRIALLVDDGNPLSVAAFENFRAGLEAHIGIPVRIYEDATHLVGIEAMRAGNLDVMWGSPFVYLLAREVMDVQRLVVTDNPASINKAVFITARDDIRTLEDMRGKSFAFISPSSSSGYFYPLYHLMNELGLSRMELEGGGFFSATAFSGGQNTSVMGVIHGDFDAAAVGSLNIDILIDTGVIDADAVRIIDSTAIIPFPGYIAAPHVPADMAEKIRAFMLAFDDEDYFHTRFRTRDTRFVLPCDEQIRHFSTMAAALEIDLSEQ